MYAYICMYVGSYVRASFQVSRFFGRMSLIRTEIRSFLHEGPEGDRSTSPHATCDILLEVWTFEWMLDPAVCLELQNGKRER